ncbi:MAG: hypothetical protein EOO68_40495 [Moraxellaceae bacterium]|nr:MAG: hypothetical protein EOO68_40495 [Moraxellaceae bacterium]
MPRCAKKKQCHARFSLTQAIDANMMPRLFLGWFCRMVPRQIEPRKFAQHGLQVAGDIPVESLVRLAAMALEVHSVAVKLEFAVAETRHRVVTGQYDGRVVMQCQRCLEPVELHLVGDVSLAIVWSEDDAKLLPSEYEPWVVAQEQADLYEIIEEELLLALPLVPTHDYDCMDRTALTPEGAAVPSENNNPFQVLARLKGSKPN